MNSALASGASFARSCSVGLSSRAAGRSWVTSGLVLSAKRSSRCSVWRDSRENVGSATNVCSSSLSRGAVAANTLVGVLDQPAQLVVALGQRAEHDAGVGDQPPHGALLAVEDVDRRARVLGERAEVAERLVDVAPVAADRLRLRLHPHLERVARAVVERAEDLVELDGRRDLRRPQPRRPRGSSWRSGCPASARRRSRPAASSGAGSPSRPTAAARSACRAG